MSAIAASPFRVAPEAGRQLASEITARKITLEFVDKVEVHAEYIPSRSIVRLGTPFLEVLWSAAHAFIVIFDEYEKANKRGEQYFHVDGTERTARAYMLYRELLQAHISKTTINWPQPAIKPVRFPVPETDGYCANEIFLTAISWVMHHEIAHARLDHEELTVNSIQQEIDADRAATEWLCIGVPEPGPQFKRALGVSCAILHLLAYDLERRRAMSTTHPPTFERLIENINRMGFPETHKIYAFAFALLEILLAQCKVQIKIDRTASFHDKLVSACLAVRSLGSAC